MRLWIESAQQCQASAVDSTPGSLIRTLTTEEGYVGFVMSGSLGPEVESLAGAMVGRPWSTSDVDTLLSALPAEEHAPVAFLHVRDGSRASLFECDAPPLFMARRGRLVLLPVVEEELAGHLVRTCQFELRDGDHLAMVSEGYIQGIGAGKAGPFLGWRDIAAAVRRLTATRCNAEQLAGALIRQYQRLAGVDAGRRTQDAGSSKCLQSAISNRQSAIAVLAMFARPMRTITVWSGPPASRAVERDVLDALMAEEDMRAVCGDTTAEIVARLLGAQLVMEPRPAGGWAEVPPVSRMVLSDRTAAVTLVTEGVVTMGVARRRLAEVPAQNPAGTARASDLANRSDGASRLAALLLTADKVQFLVGLAVNPAQLSINGIPLRQMAVELLAEDLRALGKMVSLKYF